MKEDRIKKFYQLNQYIRADQLRVIDAQGEQLGVISKDEALFKAKQQNLDLVLVAEKAQPPVAKIIDFKKFQYQQAKKEKQSQTKKTPEQKEIRFTPFIAKNDFDIRIRRAKEFLNKGGRVKLTVKFKGRELSRKNFGFELLIRATAALADLAKTISEPKFSGRILGVNLVPISKTKKSQDEKQVNEKKQD